MKVVFGFDQLLPPLQRCVLTVGNFDGVHVGHVEIIHYARRLSGDTNGPVVALTFDPHPLAIVAPGKAPPRLMSLHERVRRLGDAGAELVVVATSDRALLTLEAEQFINDVLLARFHPAHVVEGLTFGFGRGRKGTPQLLRTMLEPLGCRVHVVDPVSIVTPQGPLVVSSSTVRRLLQAGDVALAARCLGRPYAVESVVVHGAHRGRTIGIPTANIEMPEGQVEPAEGVYAGITRYGERSIPSAISIGRAETFGKGRRQVESHLIHFEGDLYGKTVRVEFLSRIRDQRKFPSAEKLVEQIRLDIDSATAFFASSNLNR